MRKLINTVLAGALGLSMISGVSAQIDDASGDVVVGITADADVNILTVALTGGDFGEHPYSLSQQTVNGTLNVTVSDNRGTNAGWNVNLYAEGNLEGVNTDASIPLANLSLAAATDSSETPPIGLPSTDIQRNPLSPVTAADQSILTATEGVGAGVYVFDIEGALVIPAGQVVDTYSTTLFITATDAP